MEILEAVLLGLIQGASEFLPISSSGHLLLLERMGVGEEDIFFNISLHLGTLAAVLICMRRELAALLRHPFNKTVGLLILACVPTVALALAFRFLAPSLIGGALLAPGFMLTACLLFASEKLATPKNRFLDVKTSLLTGVFQGIAVLPGVSRSGATIAAMRFCGVEKTEAASFSFLLSIPIILGSAIFEGVGLAASGSLGNVNAVPLLCGVAAAFVSGLIAIRFFLSLIKNRSMLPFALYTLLMAAVTLILGFVL